MFGIRQGKSMHSIDNPNAQDTKTTIAEIKRWVDEFSTERDWGKFHLPKNLAMSVAIEAAEIMELFQWSPSETLERPIGDDSALAEEMADVLSYLLRLASVTGIDLASAMQAKMLKNAIKYPVRNDYEFPSTAQ
jgi:NTP pyrophosphatase (non-canonical NTP hydrolase)